jgi:hypothetical protein
MVLNRLTTSIILFNITVGLLLYFSSQLLLSSVKDVAISGLDIFSIAVAPKQVSGQVTHPLAWTIPNYPSYAFLLFLIGNACFIIIAAIKIRRNKKIIIVKRV